MLPICNGKKIALLSGAPTATKCDVSVTLYVVAMGTKECHEFNLVSNFDPR
jgi:hypothetical protein